MKRCKICNVDVVSNKGYCPLCYNDLDSDSEESNLVVVKTHNERKKNTKKFLAKLFLVISLAVVAVCFFINFKAKSSYLWSLVVFESVVYVWILVAHTIMSKRSVFEKILFQLVGVIAIIGTTYALSPTATENWLVCYVLPSVSMFATAVLALISLISKDRKKFLLSFLAVYIALIILSLVLVCTIDNFKTLNHTALLVMSIVTFGTMLLGFKSIHKEFVKVFHI